MKNKMTDMMGPREERKNPNSDGHKAYFDYEDDAVCPYPEGNDRNVWIAGWMRAMRQNIRVDSKLDIDIPEECSKLAELFLAAQARAEAIANKPVPEKLQEPKPDWMLFAETKVGDIPISNVSRSPVRVCVCRGAEGVGVFVTIREKKNQVSLFVRGTDGKEHDIVIDLSKGVIVDEKN